ISCAATAQEIPANFNVWRRVNCMNNLFVGDDNGLGNTPFLRTTRMRQSCCYFVFAAILARNSPQLCCTAM
ncbi:hypothetical protein, partial [Xylella fastidiosa]|uniref:hypothetical protein n=1 Tax=Xylella fastidiosa TaxID=2371 RepID=UPI001EEBAA92